MTLEQRYSLDLLKQNAILGDEIPSMNKSTQKLETHAY